jgi:hypothetical protein
MPSVGDADGKAFSPLELQTAPIAVHFFPIWAKEIGAKSGTNRQPSVCEMHRPHMRLIRIDLSDNIGIGRKIPLPEFAD